ncbi:MAG: hypothetical protein K0R08_1523 [Solimicrobium sp.]|nr:hypothetical protein [Solimicrobium sp.]
MERFFDTNNSNRANLAYAVGRAFCDGKGITQSDTNATLFLSAGQELTHRYTVFELGELHSKKRTWFRSDQPMTDHWYANETSAAEEVREFVPK